MRILTLIVILISFCGPATLAREVDSDVQKVLDARIEAVKVLKNYSQNYTNVADSRRIASHMAELLEKAGLGKAVGIVRRACEQNPQMTANTGWISQIISLCDRGFLSSKNELIEIFIHESYHLYEGAYYIPENYPKLYQEIKQASEERIPYMQVLEDSEKRATTIELEVMRGTYKCVFIDTEYFKSILGLKKNKDYFICK
jgi:hypothetical protein